jgi:hypothetical protein
MFLDKQLFEKSELDKECSERSIMDVSLYGLELDTQNKEFSDPELLKKIFFPSNDVIYDTKEKTEEFKKASSQPVIFNKINLIFQTSENQGTNKTEFLGKKHNKLPSFSWTLPGPNKEKKKLTEKNLKKNASRNDNIISAIKRKIYQNVKKFIKMHLKLKNIDTSLINGYLKEDHIFFLKTKIEELFTGNLSKHHNKIENDDSNIKEIELAKKKGEHNMNELFNKTFGDILEIYRGNEPNIFEGFQTLEDDIKSLREKGENESYIKEYEFYVKNFEQKIDEIKTRKRKKEKKIEIII